MCFVLFLSILFQAGPLQAAERPNIVFILADDMRWDMMGLRGQPHHPDAPPRRPGQGRHALLERLRHDGDLRRQPRLDLDRPARTHAPLHLRDQTDRGRAHRHELPGTASPGRVPDRVRRQVRRGGSARRNRDDVRFVRSTQPHTILEETTRWLEKHLTDIEGEKAIAFIDTPPSRASRSVCR